MALGGRDVLRLIVDADSSGAIKEFNKLGKGIKDTAGDAEKQAQGLKGSFGRAFDGLAAKSPMVSGVFDKLGVSASTAGAAIASAIPMAAIAAGGAIAAFAAKGISDFQNIALAAGKFSDASGLSVEQASRWLEVADHIDVSEGAISSAFRRMGVAIGNNTQGWQDLNVQTARNADGSINLSDTFLRVVTSLQAIENPTQRAAAAQKLFGKGYAEVAELIGRSAPELAKMLGEVGDAKVINQEELEKARAFRGAMDDMGDAVAEMGMKIGQYAVPALTGLAKFVADSIEWLDKFGKKVGEVEAATGQNKGGGGLWGKISDALTGAHLDFKAKSWDDFIVKAGEADQSVTELAGNMGTIVWKASNMGDAVGPAANAFVDFSRNTEIATDMNTDFGGSADAVAQNVGDEASALRDANDALAEHTDAILSAFDATFAAKDAEFEFAKALMEAETKAQDSTVSAGDLATAYDEETKKAVDAAEANVRLADETAKAEGKTLSAKDAQNILIGSLQTMASQASGPTKDALNILIGKLQDTGNQKPNPVITVTDNATSKIQSARDTLIKFGGLSATAAANVTADTSSADRALQGFLSRVRNSNGMVVIGGLTRASGGPIPGNRHQPVPVMAHGGEYVLSADVVDRIKKGGPSKGAMGPGGFPTIRGAGAGRVTNVTVNTGIGDPVAIGRAVKQAVAAAERAGVN